MADPEPLDFERATPAKVPELLDDYRREQAALRKQSDDVAKLRREVLIAADREALSIVTGARAEIRRIIIDARQELLGLAAQIEVITESLSELQAGRAARFATSDLPPAEAALLLPAEAGHHSRDRLLGARHDIRMVLDEARPDLEHLRDDALKLHFEPGSNGSAKRLVQEDAHGSPLESQPVWHANTADGNHADLVKPLERAASGLESTYLPSPTPVPDVGRDWWGDGHSVSQREQFETQVSEPAATPVAPFSAPEAESLPDARVWQVEPALPTGDVESEAEHRPGPGPESRPHASGRLAKSWVVVFAIVGAGFVLGTISWMRTLGRTEVAPQSRPAAAAPTASSPTVTPPAVVPPQPPVASLLPETSLATLPTTAAPPIGNRAGEARRLSVVVAAERPSWIRTTVDGMSDIGRTFAAGETRTIGADHAVSLRVGDAGAVSVSVNGGEPQKLGRAGEVVIRDFVANQSVPPSRPAAASPWSDNGSGRAPSSARADALPVPRAGGTAPTGVTTSAASVGQPSPAAAPTRSAAAPALPGAAPAGRGAPAPGQSSDVAPELGGAAQRWLDAYYRQDAGTMKAFETRGSKTSDERSADERLPSGLTVRRSLERVTFQFVGESAILTARMTEQASVGGQALQSVSWVSQVWIREAGQWRLMDVRLLGDSKLK